MTEDIDFSEALENYLDEHDYNLPEAGDIRKAVIVSITADGVIVDLGVKRDGFVAPADLAKLSEKERAGLAVDQEIPVYIISTGNQESLNVSIHRAFLNDDWIKAQELLESGDVTEAEVVGYNRGGALVEFGRLRGFIPLSQLSDFRPGMKDREKQRLLSKLRGESLPLKVIEVDRRRRRLVVSHRDAQREWLTARRGERFEELESGQTLHGRVSSLRDFGAFVDVGDGVEGLVHVSELAWYRIEHPREVTKVGAEMDVYILTVDAERQRVSLSRKRLLPDPWTQVEEKYALGELVEGKITRLVNYGAFVELEPGIEGLLHSSKLARNDVNDPSEIVREGETHLLRVISIDPERQRIGLSLKAVTQQEQIDWMMRQEAKAAEPEVVEADDDDDDEVVDFDAENLADMSEDAPDAEQEDSAEEEAEEASAIAEVAVEAEPEAESEPDTTEVEPEAESEPDTAEETPSEEATAEVEPEAESEPDTAEETPSEEVAAEVEPEAESEPDTAEETPSEEVAAEAEAESEPDTAEESPSEEVTAEVEPEAESEPDTAEETPSEEATAEAEPEAEADPVDEVVTEAEAEAEATEEDETEKDTDKE